MNMSEAVKNLIIKHRSVVEDDWTVLRFDVAPECAEPLPPQDPATYTVPPGKVIVPLAVWLAQRDALGARVAAGEIGVWIASDERADALKGQLDQFAVVAVDFPKFTDGRGYSIAYNLRTRLAYTGQLRAIGDVLRDQLFSMKRVGFDAYATRPDRSIEDALKGLTVFSETSQASVDQSQPLFRRHLRSATAPGEHKDVGAGI